MHDIGSAETAQMVYAFLSRRSGDDRQARIQTPGRCYDHCSRALVGCCHEQGASPVEMRVGDHLRIRGIAVERGNTGLVERLDSLRIGFDRELRHTEGVQHIYKVFADPAITDDDDVVP